MLPFETINLYHMHFTFQAINFYFIDKFPEYCSGLCNSKRKFQE